MGNYKISVLMPAYNDEEYVGNAIDSVLKQTFSSWELLIMDDGSTDNTAIKVKEYKDNRIRLFQQENQGQLKAILNLSRFITGDVVMMLHSDDWLYSDNVLEQNIKYFDDEKIDGLFCSLIQFNQDGITQNQPKNKKIGIKDPAVKLLAFMGSNFIMDPFFIRKEKFQSHVLNNYLKWNMPYWLDFRPDTVLSLHLQFSEFPWYCYRVYSGNYINSLIGNFETFLGRMRTTITLSGFYTIMLPRIQKECTRRFKIPVYALHHASSHRHIALLIKNMIRLMRKENPDSYVTFFATLKNYYSKRNARSIVLDSEIRSVYSGSDGRQFYKDMIGNSLPAVYREIIREANNGFNGVYVKNEQEKEQLEIILKFLCIQTDIIVH